MEYHQMDQYLYYRDPRRRRDTERVRSLFKEIMVENFPNFGKETDIHMEEVQRVLTKEEDPH